MSVEVGKIGGDLFFDLLPVPAEGLTLLRTLLVRVPDHTVPVVVCSLEDVSVCQ